MAHQFARVLQAPDLVAAYATLVPVRSYEDHRADIETCAHGVPDVLTADEIDMVGGSSGTTTAVKYIPGTGRTRATFQRFAGRLIRGVLLRELSHGRWYCRWSRRPGINLMSMVPATRRFRRLPFGTLTNAGMAKLGGFARIFWTSPQPAFAIRDSQSALYIHALFAIGCRDAAYAMTVFAPQLHVFFALIESRWPDLVRDLERGSVNSGLLLTKAERRAITSFIEPDPDRASELHCVFSSDRSGFVARIWPDMRAVIAITTGSFALALPRLRVQLGPDIAIYSPLLAASESVLGISLSVSPAGNYVLALGAAYFEFLPLSDESSTDTSIATTRQIGDLRVGSKYELVVTTTSGLYRYRMDDVVEIVGFEGVAPIFRFAYRRGSVVDLIGEKVTEAQALNALTAALTPLIEAKVVDYTISTPEVQGAWRYVFYVELEPAVHIRASVLQRAADQLERCLSRENAWYLSRGRQSGTLAALEFRLVRPGTFARVGEYLLASREGLERDRIKTPKLISDPDLLSLLESGLLAVTRSRSAPDWEDAA